MSVSKKHSNRLVEETSPYLLQHAHNPVNWYPWGPEALDKAKAEDKPLLVSIGYSACHWCHVMERESFENEETAALMNNLFINVKIDREERPDLDHIYMEAVQAISGSGGWPLHVFLTPDLQPFYGGTYFPPVPAHGRSSWNSVLVSLANAWDTRRPEILQQAKELTEHISNASPFKLESTFSTDALPEILTPAELQLMQENVLSSFDKKYGGFGGAPKFLHTHSIQFLLQHHHYTGNTNSLAAAEKCLLHMVQSGIYDQVNGGISRYSTDNEWKIPHFEKMLYDNALLLHSLSDCFLLTKKEIYKYYILKTINFLKSEMQYSSGLYYAALDADSEGIEGKFYIFTADEIEELLQGEGAEFCNWFSIKKEGNLTAEQPYWEGRNVLHTHQENIGQFPPENVLKALDQIKKIRDQRIRPATDVKMLLGWNALLINSFCRAAIATQDESFTQEAEQLYNAICTTFIVQEKYYHVSTKGKTNIEANLDDLAYFADACLALQELTGNVDYLKRAHSVMQYIDAHFEDQSQGYYFFSSDLSTDVPLRKKEFYDSAVSCGNAVIAGILFRLSIYYDRKDWREKAENMVLQIKEATLKYPNTFSTWGVLLQKMENAASEIVISGENIHKNLLKLHSNYLPFIVLQKLQNESESWPLLEGKNPSNALSIWLCKNYLCNKPVHSIEEFLRS